MEMLTPIPFVVSMGHILQGGKRALAGFCAGVMATTIFLSGSRGGMIAFICQSIVFAASAFGKRRSPRLAMGSVAVWLLSWRCYFSWTGTGLGPPRGLRPDIRLNITKDSLKLFSHRPVMGWGLGTFPTIYPRYRSFYTNLFINEAHNDYAQLLVEMGALGFVLMLWFLASLYRQGLPTSRSWEFRWDWAVSLAALLGCTGILVHSLVDFNLQIPANAAWFYSLCGLAACKPIETASRRKRSRSIRQEESGVRHGSSDHDEPSEWSK